MNINQRFKKAQGSGFTLIELVMVMAIVMLLVTLTLPSYRDARQRAKFARWYAYNQQWNRDPDCVVNFNFQEGYSRGKGNLFNVGTYSSTDANKKTNRILHNGAESCDWNNGLHSYNARDFDGRFAYKYDANYSESSKLFSWTKGRWGIYKKALRFTKDSYTCVKIGKDDSAFTRINYDAIVNGVTGDVQGVFYDYAAGCIKNTATPTPDPQRDPLDFTPLDNFTIVAWIKYESQPHDNYQCVFARGSWGDCGTTTNPNSDNFGTSQFDMYSDIKSGAGGAGSFDVDLSTVCFGFDDDAVNFNNLNWKQLVVRYQYPAPPAKAGDSSAAAYRCGDVFIDGKLQSGKRATYNLSSVGSRSKGLTILGGAPVTTYGKDFNFPFGGLMDEFIIFKKALTDIQIAGNYKMGVE